MYTAKHDLGAPLVRLFFFSLLLHDCQQITPHYDAPMQKKELKKARDNNVDATTTASNIACEIGSIGFKEKSSHRLVDVPFCHIATPAINDALRASIQRTPATTGKGLVKTTMAAAAA